MRAFLLLALISPLVSPVASLADTERTKFQVLAQDTVIHPESVKIDGPNTIFEFHPIDVTGFNAARFMVLLRKTMFDNKPDFPKTSQLRLIAFDDTHQAAYCEKEISINHVQGAAIHGWTEIPVSGRNLRVVLLGDNIPNTEMAATCYLLLVRY